MSGGARGRRGRALATILGCLVLCAGIGVLGWALAPDDNPDGQCEGLGWGCTPTPRDTILFGALLAGVPLALGTLVLSGVAVALAERRQALPTLGGGALGMLAFAAGLLGSVLLGGLVVLGAALT